MIRPLKILLMVLGTILALILIWTGFSMYVVSHIDLPKYTVVEKKRGHDFRIYEPYTIAEVLVPGDFEGAINEGVKRLSKYYSPNLPLREIVTGDSNNYHFVSFIIKTGSTTEAAPSKDIRFHLIEKQKVASLEFSGYATPTLVANMRRRLANYLIVDQREAFAEPVFIRYTPWYVIPFLMKNEIQVEI